MGTSPSTLTRLTISTIYTRTISKDKAVIRNVSSVLLVYLFFRLNAYSNSQSGKEVAF